MTDRNRRAGRRRSLRLRVTSAAVGLIALVLVVGALALAGLLRRALEQDTEALLRQQIDEVQSLAASGSLPTVLDAKGREIGQIQVYDEAGNLVAATRGFAQTAHLDIVDAPTAGSTRTSTVSGAQIDSDAGERYRLVARTVQTPAGRRFIYGVSSLSAADNAVRTMVIALLAGVPLLVGVAGWVLWRSVGRALMPVDAMRSEVDEIEATSLERRVTAPSSDDELGRLAHTLNHLLDRLDADAKRQRQFAADASHELRSPLASARTQLEVGLVYPDRTDWTETASDVLVEIDRLERLSRELLEFARVDPRDGVVRRATMDLGDVIARAISSAPPSSVPIHWHPYPQSVPLEGDDDLITRVLRNLLSNAQRHARSRIDVDICAEPDRAWVRVMNDGVPLSEADRDQIFQPFTRLEAARDSDSGGAGLGLSISQRIARSHGGDLIADAMPEGASFTLWLPRRSTQEPG